MKTPKRQNENIPLEKTLARRVRQLRELKNLTVLDISRASRMSLKRVEAIESGQEIWLSIKDRTILARALGVQAAILQEVEACPTELTETRLASIQAVDEIADRILAGEVQIPCPKCNTMLKCSVENAIDIEGQPTQFARAYCPVCPFSVK